jgi:hypothetical protein
MWNGATDDRCSPRVVDCILGVALHRRVQLADRETLSQMRLQPQHLAEDRLAVGRADGVDRCPKLVPRLEVPAEKEVDSLLEAV